MRTVLKTSLRRKMIFVILTSVGFAVLMAGVAFTFMEVRNFRVSARRELRIMADVLGEASIAAIEFKEPEEARRLLTTLQAQKHVTDAAILDAQGHVFATYRRLGEAPEPLPSVLTPNAFGFHGGHFCLASAIHHGGERYGTIYLREDMAELMAHLRWVLILGLLATLLIGTVASLVAIHMGRLVVDPILHLTEAAYRMANRQGPGGRVVRETQDEVGLLVDAFNKMLDQLGERQARLEEAQSLAHLGSWALVPATGRPEWSDETFHILGLPVAAQAPENEAFRRLLHPEDLRLLDALQDRVFRDGGQFEADLRFFKPGGTLGWIHLFGARFQDAEGQGMLRGTIMDITERKRAEAALLQGQKLESLGVLAGGIAHDFNNLLAAIQGYLDLMSLELAEGSRATELLGKAERVITKASGLVGQMLTYSGKVQFRSMPLDLSALVREMTHLLSVSISKKVDLRLEIAERLPSIIGDPAQIQQVVMNLVINASDALEGQDGFIRITTEEETLEREDLAVTYVGQQLEPGRFVALQVQDNGQGMDAATLTRIFDPFFTTKFKGRGLGLAAMLGIVKAHQGGVKVYSEVGKGTTFKVLFPASSQATAGPAEESGDGTYQGAGLVVLVDDENDIRTATAMLLQKLGFEVVEAADGRVGLDLFTEHQRRVSLVILDHTMPHMDGTECYQHIRALAPAVPVLMISGFGEGECQVALQGPGPAAFLQKPFNFARLRAKVRALLAAT